MGNTGKGKKEKIVHLFLHISEEEVWDGEREVCAVLAHAKNVSYTDISYDVQKLGEHCVKVPKDAKYMVPGDKGTENYAIFYALKDGANKILMHGIEEEDENGHPGSAEKTRNIGEEVRGKSSGGEKERS